MNITSSLSSSFAFFASKSKEVAPACVSRGSDARRLSVHKSQPRCIDASQQRSAAARSTHLFTDAKLTQINVAS